MMILQYTPDDMEIEIKSDLAGEFPLYVYWPRCKSVLLYSSSINELLNDTRVAKPLVVNNDGLSFLLQSGVVPPPMTAYKDIYLIGMGDRAKVATKNGRIELEFKKSFPFMNASRLTAEEMQPDVNLILEMLAQATACRIDESKPSFLFHSAGKDSNSIALALAEAGWQDKFTLITHKSKGKDDESEISLRIAKQLGFRHKILYEVDSLNAEHNDAVKEYFVNAPFPCTDNVTLAYPLYAQQLPELRGANLIDGGGNDSHMCTPPSARELKVMRLSKFTHHARFLRNFVRSEGVLSPLIRTPAEWCGMTGLSFADSKGIFSESRSVYPYWRRESLLKDRWDLFDFKSSILTGVTASEMHIRKARNFADSIKSNFVLPFAHPEIAEYFGRMPEIYLFDRKRLKNKLILREILKEKIGLDSDALGKMGWVYDSRSITLQNWNMISAEISSCVLWNQAAVSELVNRLSKKMQSASKYARLSGRLIYQIYLLSAWHNYNKYLN